MFKKIFKRMAWFRPSYVAVIAVSMVCGGLIAVVAMSATGAPAQPAVEAKSTDPATLRLQDLDRRLSLAETQIALGNMDYTWEYDNQEVLSCIDHIDPDPADFGPDRRSWRAQIRKAGGVETLGTFIPAGEQVNFLGRNTINTEVTVELDVGTAYEMHTKQRPPGHRWDEAWTPWQSCGILLPKYPQSANQATWLQVK